MAISCDLVCLPCSRHFLEFRVQSSLNISIGINISGITTANTLVIGILVNFHIGAPLVLCSVNFVVLNVVLCSSYCL